MQSADGMPVQPMGGCRLKDSPQFEVGVYNDVINNVPTPYASVEAFVVAKADEIAQRHHDLEDAYLAGLMSVDAIRKLACEALNVEFDESDGSGDNNGGPEWVRGRLSRVFVHELMKELATASKQRLSEFESEHGIHDHSSMRKWLDRYTEQSIDKVKNLVSYSDEFGKKEQCLRQTLKTTILHSGPVQRMDGKAQFLLRQLWKAYLSNPQLLPDEVLERVSRDTKWNWKWKEVWTHVANGASIARRQLAEGVGLEHREELRAVLARAICDHIASMTDQEAVEEHQRLYSSHSETVHLGT